MIIQRPNVNKHQLYSPLLRRKLKIPMTNHALRQMRLKGGIDNYILLTDPKHLDSIYGEYLRRLMISKLKDPNYRLPYIVKS